MSTAYNFSTAGPGTFSRFQVAGLDGTVGTNIIDTHSITVIVTDGVSKCKLDIRTANVNCFKPDWAAILEGGLRDARFLALIADLYVYQYGADDPLYKEYFGTSDPRTIMIHSGYIIDRAPLPENTSPVWRWLLLYPERVELLLLPLLPVAFL